MKNLLKRTAIVLGALFVGLLVLGLIGMAAGVDTDDKPAVAKAEPVAEKPVEEKADDEPWKAHMPEPSAEQERRWRAAREADEEAAEPEMTSAQENAVATAQDYLDYSGFSAKGLTEQLTFEDYSQADATFAVANVDVDWNAEAVEAAQDYLDYSSFSSQGLLEQLTFEGFTPEQAQHAVSQVY